MIPPSDPPDHLFSPAIFSLACASFSSAAAHFYVPQPRQGAASTAAPAGREMRIVVRHVVTPAERDRLGYVRCGMSYVVDVAHTNQWGAPVVRMVNQSSRAISRLICPTGYWVLAIRLHREHITLSPSPSTTSHPTHRASCCLRLPGRSSARKANGSPQPPTADVFCGQSRSCRLWMKRSRSSHGARQTIIAMNKPPPYADAIVENTRASQFFEVARCDNARYEPHLPRSTSFGDQA